MKNQQKRITRVLFVLALCTFGASVAWSQEQQVEKGTRPGQQGQASAPDVPQMENQVASEGRGLLAARMVKFSGVAKDQTGAMQTGILGMTFAIYRDQEGGAPLWMETQNVQVDEQGHYSVLLGATKSEGLPVELFTGAEPRWLGVQLAGETERARVLLVSVPYALKAADAESLGGKPASAYMLAPETTAGVDAGGTGGSDTGAGPVPTKNRVTAPGGKATPQLITANFVPVFMDSNGMLANSLLVQSGNSMALGQGVSGNASVQFDVNGGIRGTGLATNGRSVAVDAINTGALFLGGSNAMGLVGTNAQFAPGGLFTKTSIFSGGLERMTILGNPGNVGIGTTSPSSFFQLHVVANGNTTAVEGQTSAAGGFAGVGGESLVTTSIGVVGQNFGGGGVDGFDTFNIGVAGQSNNGIGVDGSVVASGATAVRARVANAGAKLFSGLDPSNTEKFGVDASGNVNLSGKLTAPNGVSTPIAYAFISSGGAVSRGTSNVSSSFDSTNTRYLISLTGVDYFFSSFVTIVTPVGAVQTTKTDSVGGQLIVQLFNSAGTAVAGDFQFVTFQP